MRVSADKSPKAGAGLKVVSREASVTGEGMR